VLSLLSPCCALDLTDEKGHLCEKIMADLGVEVIKVEPLGGDPSRSIGPFYKDIPHPEKSLSWFAFNSGKKSITLNIEKREGKAIFYNLVKGADFIIESFPPGVMDKWGWNYDAFAKIKPDIIMISASAQGQTGPRSRLPGYGMHLSSLSGFVHLTGWPDLEPAMIYGAYTDFITPYFGAAAVAAALDYRRRTGKGQYIDLSQYACAL
jgi:crotonobetainyl-CoA:carnitine CoA-transferase CaiB-like acyl-CoA transferase